MRNPHLIVGSGRRCLCGSYSGRAIGCSEVISALEHLEHFGDDRQKDSLAVLRAVLDPLIEDCADEYEVDINAVKIKAPSLLGFGQVVQLAGLKGFPTVTYFHRKSGRQGCLSDGQSVVVESGMVFTVVHTSNA